MLQADIVYALQTQEMKQFCMNGIFRKTRQDAEVLDENQVPSQSSAWC